MQIRLPNNWQPRWYQTPLWRYLEHGGRRAVMIGHRRFGKDDICLHWTAIAAHQRIGNYGHCLPEYTQARKAIWKAVNPHTGQRRIDEAFPKELRKSTNDQEMFIEFLNGSTWQLLGSDSYDRLVGTAYAGMTFSEWALANPMAWGYVQPILIENKGWALFITTPRGGNHAKSLYERACKSDDWYAEVATVKDTKIMDEAALEEARQDLIAIFGQDVGDAQFQQEYYCSFNAAILGAYFGKEMADAERDGRICDVEVDHNHPVHTAWDLGKAANNPIWCFQVIDGQPRIVDFYRPENDDVGEWVRWLNERGYHGNDYLPHDAIQTEWGSGRTRIEVLRSHGRENIRRIPLTSVEDGRNAARETIKLALFDETRCELGVSGLQSYRREWDTELHVFRTNPVKDWAEHIGSSFRYLGLAWRELAPSTLLKQQTEQSTYVGTKTGTNSTMTVQELINRQARLRNKPFE